MTMPAEPPPGAVFSLIAAHHVDDLTPRQAQVLVLQAFGLDERRVARILKISVSTLQNHARAARLRVLPDPLGATRPYAQCWAFCHHACCLAGVWGEWARSGQEWWQEHVAEAWQAAGLHAAR